MDASGFGLFDPALEKDSCGVGFIADIKGRKSHRIVEDALTILVNLEHRGAPATAPAFWSRYRTSSLPRRQPNSASSCRPPATTPSVHCSCRATTPGARRSWTPIQPLPRATA